jgi:Flp pilus assembly pilin Flp
MDRSKKSLKRVKLMGQSTAEYAVLLALVAVALVTMQVYIKRSIQGRLKDLATQLAPSPGGTSSGGQQYESQKESDYITSQVGATIEKSDALTANIYQDEITLRSGYEVVSKETQ